MPSGNPTPPILTNTTTVTKVAAATSVTRNVVKTVHITAKVAGHTATPLPPAPPKLVLPSIVIWVAVAVVAVFLIVFVYLVFIRGVSRSKLVPRHITEALGMGFSPVDSDMIGVVRYLDTNRMMFVPLKRVGPSGLKISVHPRYPLIVLPYPQPTTYSLGGRPAVDVMAVGGLGFEVNMNDLMSIGIASLTIESPRWNESSNPRKAIEELIETLAKKQSEETATIPITPDLKIGISVHVPQVITSFIRTCASVSNAVLYATHDEIVSHEEIGRIIERASAIREQARASSIAKILAGVAVVVMVVVIGLILWSSLVPK